MEGTANAPDGTHLPFRAVKNDLGFYTALNEERGHIRYVDLHPGSVGESLVCSLGYAILGSGKISYEALSYCWGDLNDLTEIRLGVPGAGTNGSVLNGRQQYFKERMNSFLPFLPKEYVHEEGMALYFGNFRITRNLETALRALRKPKEARRLWIDAICINQMDKSEKTHQVRQMNKIYALAKRVIVWLGLADQDSTAVFRGQAIFKQEERGYFWDSVSINLQKTSRRYVSKEILRQIAHDYRSALVRDSVSDALRRQEVRGTSLTPQPPPDMSMVLLRNLDNFLRRPWFKRIWVYPEVLLAPLDKYGNRLVTIVCGNSTISWPHLLELIYAIENFSYVDRSFHWEKYESITWFRRSWYLPTRGSTIHSNLKLAEYCLRTADFEASDPRDKIFALLHLAQDTQTRIHQDPKLLPDYAKSWLDIMFDYSRQGIFPYLEIRTDQRLEEVDLSATNAFNFGIWILDGPNNHKSGTRHYMDHEHKYPFRTIIITTVTEFGLFASQYVVTRRCEGHSHVMHDGRWYHNTSVVGPSDVVITCSGSAMPFIMSSVPKDSDRRRYRLLGTCSPCPATNDP